MNVEQIGKKLSAYMYSRMEQSERSYSYEKYWEINHHYFLDRAQGYVQVKESLEAQDLAATIGSKKRNEERNLLTSSIFYMPVPKAHKNDISWGVTVDVSRYGVGIYTRDALEEGSSVKVHSEDLWNNGRTARIKWCKEVRKNLYRSGLFLE